MARSLTQRNCEDGTVAESIILYVGDAGGNGYTGQTRAAIKQITDTINAVWDYRTGQTAQLAKAPTPMLITLFGIMT